MKMSSIARSGAKGNRSLLSKYGGSPGSGPLARQKYANGGAVASTGRKFADGGMVDGDDEGAPAPKRLDKPGRKMKGKGKDKKDAKTNINVIVMAGKGDQPPGAPPMPPPGPMAGPPPMPPKPMGPPPGAPPMGPPMGMHAKGGKVKGFAKGGVVSMDAGAGGAKGRLEKMKAYGKAKGGKC